MQFQVQVRLTVLKLLRDHYPNLELIEQLFTSSQVILELQRNGISLNSMVGVRKSEK